MKTVGRWRNERIKTIRIWIEQYKIGKECIICSENHPACLDFHHVDRTIKEFSIGAFPRKTYTLKKVQEEIAKCIIICSNCHRKKHYEEKKMDREIKGSKAAPPDF